MENLSIKPEDIDNAVLKRLIAEVQYEQQNKIDAYNRVHNRHNRSPGPRPVQKPQEEK